MRTLKMVCVWMLLMVLNITSTYAIDVVNTSNGWYGDEVQKCISMLPYNLVKDYDGTIYIVDTLPIKDEPWYTGIYYHDSHDIYIEGRDVLVVIHELGHYIYYTTPINKNIADALYDALQGYKITGYTELDRYHYNSEIFSYMFVDYCLNNLDNDSSKRFGELIDLMIEERTND